ncbi:MAG: hypothetical protein OXC99_11385 [Chloroflexi bacterium]|nr:hypothetical protein [Chloroflexota bacterium]
MRDAPRDPNNARDRQPRRRRGAPLGNQNARKRNLYKHLLTPREQESLRAVERASGLSWEIDRLRPWVAAMLNNPNVHLDDVLLAARTLFDALQLDKQINPARWSRG